MVDKLKGKANYEINQQFGGGTWSDFQALFD